MSDSSISLKATDYRRVDTGRAFKLGSNRQDLGLALMCPANAQNLQHDIYGRPSNQNCLQVNLDAACAQGSQFPSYRQIAIENQLRPYVPLAAPGSRSPGDFLGVGRDLQPRNLYADGERGNFVRTYPTANDAPWEQSWPEQKVYRRVPEFDFSHDATRSAGSWYHG